MTRLKRILSERWTGIAFILGAHWALLYWLAEKDVVATLFAAGEHVPVFSILLATAFLVMRLLALVYVPGFLIAKAGLFLVRRCRRPVRPS